MQIDANNLSWFQVPDDIKKLLILAAQNWENTSDSEKYINLVLAKTGEYTDVLVAAYRYFFYKQNYQMALRTVKMVIDKIKASENLPDDWNQLKPILTSRQEEPNIRLYLNAYSASGLVLAKLGEIEQAKKIITLLKEIDDKNEFGSSIILKILTCKNEEE